MSQPQIRSRVTRAALIAAGTGGVIAGAVIVRKARRNGGLALGTSPTAGSFESAVADRRGRIRRIASTLKGDSKWSIPRSQRPPLVFGEGDVSQVFGVVHRVRLDSPGAAVALVRFLSMHQPHANATTARDQERARNELTRLLTQISPTDASLANAFDGDEEMRGAANIRGILSARFTYLEQQYLLLVQERRANLSIEEIASELLMIADDFAQADSTRRQACVRAMLADILLQLRQFDDANEQMVMALALIGTVYPNELLVKLAKTVNTQLAERVLESAGNDAATATRPGSQHTSPPGGRQIKTP